jgi:hypothetical protein
METAITAHLLLLNHPYFIENVELQDIFTDKMLYKRAGYNCKELVTMLNTM